MTFSKNHRTVDPLSLDWGEVTPEFANIETREAVHVFNHALGSTEEKDRTVRFVNARIAWFAKELPPGWMQHVRIDDRGQTITDDDRANLANQIVGARSVHFMSRGRA